MGRKMFAQGGVVYPMQEGGMAPPMDPMAPPMDPMAPPMDPMAPPMAEMSQELDPAILEGMLGEYSQQMSDIDNASDATTMINGIRGDELPLEARYAELASVVGQEDAQATPESVLTLVQPVMQLAAIDQGIGGLAEEQMMAPIEGPMAGGIMSTVNMGASESPVQVPGGPAPVNFNQGGAVQYMAPGGVAQTVKNLNLSSVSPDLYTTAQTDASAFDTLFEKQKERYGSILGGNQESDLSEQKNLTQAQMLFDIAQGALAFAAPSDREMSAAENLAQSFSPVLGNIGARAGELGKFKQAQQSEKRQLDLAALGSTEKVIAAGLESKNAVMLKKLENAQSMAKLGLQAKLDSALQKQRGDQNLSLEDQKLRNKKALEIILDSNRLSMEALRQSGSSADIVLRDVLAKENQNLTYDLKLSEMGVANRYDLEKLTKTHEQASELQSSRLMVQSNIAYNKLAQDELFKTISAAQGDDKLELEQRKLALDKEELVLKGSLAKLDQFGKSVDAKILTIVAGEGSKDLASRYATGNTTADENILLETVLPIFTDSSTTFDPETGAMVTKPGNTLPSAWEKAIEARSALGLFSTEIVSMGNTFDTDLKTADNSLFINLSTAETPEQKQKFLAAERDENTGLVPSVILKSAQFNKTLLGTSGEANLDSPSWRMIPTQTFTPGLDYDIARGLSTIPDRVYSAYNEIISDVTKNGGRRNKAGELIYQADNDFLALKMRTQSVLARGVSEGRIVKSVQDQVNSFIEPMKPGIFKFDGKALANIKSINGVLAAQFDANAKKLSEYGGNPDQYSAAQVFKARETLDSLKPLMAEFVQFGDQMEFFLKSPNTGLSTIQKRRNIRSFFEKNQ